MLKRLSMRVFAPFQLFYWRMAMPRKEGAKVLIEHNGKYLLIRERVGQKNWTLPGGSAKGNERAEDTARRKAKEEAGVSVGALEPLGSYFHTRQHRQDVVSAFYANTDSPLYQVDANTVAEAGWFTVEEIHALEKSESVSDVLELYAKYRADK